MRRYGLLFLGLACLLAAMGSGHLYGNDGAAYFRMAESLYLDGWFDVPSPEKDMNMRGGSFGSDGLYYTPFQLGYPLYVLPLYAVGFALFEVLRVNYAMSLVVSFGHSLTTAATWTLVAAFLVLRGFAWRRAWLLSVAGLCSSLALPYARYDYSEPLLGLFLVAGLVSAERYRQGRSAAPVGLAVGALGALLVRAPALVSLPWLLLPAVWPVPEQRSGVGRRVVAGGALAAGIAAGVAVALWFNWARYGSPFESGYATLPNGEPRGFTSPLWYGLAVFLVAPGKALWLFNPLALLGVAGWRPLRERRPDLLVMSAGMVLSNLVLYSVWCRPEGGYTWGPRFFVPLVPFLLLPAFEALRGEVPRTLRRLAVGLVVVGCGVQVLGLSVNFAGVIQRVDMGRGVPLHERYYNPIKGRYNLWFSPWEKHLRHLGRVLSSETGLFGVRRPQLRARSYGAYLVNVPLWDDAPDFWLFHLVKDGFPASVVVGVWFGLVVVGLLCCWLSFRWRPPPA